MDALSRNSVHILQMTSQISTLCECFLAERTFEWAQAGMLAEVVPQITTLLEYTAALRVLALEVQLDPLSFRVLHPDGLVPLLRNTFKCFVLVSS